MHIEKWIIAHFSPTGGTKKVTDAIAAGFNTPVVEMDLTSQTLIYLCINCMRCVQVCPLGSRALPMLS